MLPVVQMTCCLSAQISYITMMAKKLDLLVFLWKKIFFQPILTPKHHTNTLKRSTYQYINLINKKNDPNHKINLNKIFYSQFKCGFLSYIKVQNNNFKFCFSLNRSY